MKLSLNIKLIKLPALISIVVLLPYIYGCNTGGGSANGGDPSGGAVSSLNNGNSNSNVSQNMATLHQPEPATILLFAAGMMGMAATARRKKN